MPLTRHQWEESLRQPAFCELLSIRDYLDNIMVRTNGSFVAGYAAVGLNTFYHDDDTRNRTKETLESLIRSLPERSMRMQVRLEIGEGNGNLAERYAREQRTENAVLQALDRERVRMWRNRDGDGQYLNRRLEFYFIWNPEVHHESPDFEWRKARTRGKAWSLSADKCIQRTLREHQDLLSEFESLMAGIEATLEATGQQARRMTDQQMFLEVKRALQPLGDDQRLYKQGMAYESARSQAANVNIEDEEDDHLKVGGLLYSWISLKEMPDATFPGIMRELVAQEFPVVVSAEVSIPDQSRIMRSYKRRLLRMQAAQRDIHGGFKINVEAQIAQEQLVKTLQDVVSSSLKVCQFSLVAGLRTSQPIRNFREREEAERILADRRQRILHAVTRMNGGRGIPETLAQKRIFIGTLPGLAEETKRELECLTLHAADLLPVELPWQGTTDSPGILLETPSRQMVPFSPFDPGLGDANMLIMAKSGGGKTIMAQLLLLMLARSNAQISILERGDSYQPLVDLMGGRVIEVILLVLGAGGIMLAVSARKARALGRLQMEFVAGVTHELRTPLAVISSAGQNLADGVATGQEKVRSYGALIRDHSRRLTDTVDQVLRFGGLSSGRVALALEPTSVEALLDQAVEDSSHELATAGASLTRHIAPGLPPIAVNHEAMGQCLRNLLINAARHGAGSPISVRAGRDARHIEIEVENGGPGIDPRDLRRIFEPFRRGRRAVEEQIPGTGLGLALVKSIVEAHRGSVKVSSEPGRTCFRLRLPLAERG